MDEDSQEQRDHVARSMLPWRADQLAECGRIAADVDSLISLDELEARTRRCGQERTWGTVCMTCWDISRHAARWETNPVGVIAREAVRVGIGHREPSSPAQVARFAGELRAIAALIEAHRDEFDGYLAALESTTSITDHRKARRRVQ